MRGTSVIDDMELGSCRQVKNPPLPTQDAAYLLRLAKKKKKKCCMVHRLTLLLKSTYFIIFHCQRELTTNDNVYEFDFSYKLLGKLLERITRNRFCE